MVNVKNARGSARMLILAIVAVLAVALLYFNLNSGHSVEDVANAELKALRSGDMQAAYNLTSPSFKQRTTLDVFSAFVGRYPKVKNYTSVSLSDNFIDKKTAAMAGFLIDSDGNKMKIQMQFVKDGKVWRIQTLGLRPERTVEPRDVGDHGGSTIQNIMVSDVVDKNGYVTKTKSTIDKHAAKIYLTVNIHALKAGGQVDAVIVKLKNGQKFASASDKITREGDVNTAFIFTKTTSAWEAGDYMALVQLPSGIGKSLQFTVN